MSESNSRTAQPLLAKLLREYLRTELRGSYRVTKFLAHQIKSLHAIPVTVGRSNVYVDLRMGGSDQLLRQSPFDRAPIEREEQELMKQLVRPGDVVFDVGANIGLHTLLLSELVGNEGMVCVFEPNPGLLPTLQLTISQLTNCKLFPIALSDEHSDDVPFFIPDDHTMGSLANWTEGRLATSAVETVCIKRRLDDLLQSEALRDPDFIKCDVEGAELSVFRGAFQTLNKPNAPIILFEVNAHTAKGFGLPTDAAFQYLRSLQQPNYSLFKTENAGLRKISSVEDPHSNILAVPEAKLKDFKDVKPLSW